MAEPLKKSHVSLRFDLTKSLAVNHHKHTDQYFIVAPPNNSLARKEGPN